MSSTIIDVWSDIACPWCWIGKRHLDAAVAASDIEVEVVWHAFELNPQAPRDAPASVDYAERLARKYGRSKADAQTMIDRMVEAGRERGIEMRFDKIRPSNTFDAHRLVAWAGDSGADASQLKGRLFQAYLGEGEAMSEHATLIHLANDVGLDEEEAQTLLASDRYADKVRADENAAARLGIRGVPAFVFGGTHVVSGAQPPGVIRQLLSDHRRP